MTAHPATGARAGAKEWLGFTVLLVPLILVAMDVSVLYFAIPFITEDLQPSNTQQLWILDIYGFILAGLLIIMGTTGDRIGRRLLLLIGAAWFGAASILAAYSTSPEMLIFARALLGVGGATLMPSTLALVRNIFPDDRQRGMAVAIWTAAMSGGVALGPVISGALLENFWWGSVFLVNVPAAALLLIMTPIFVPESKNPSPARFDVLSALLTLVTMIPVIYGIKKLAADGWSYTPLLFIVGGLVAGTLFVWRQIASPGSLIDIQLFRRSAFSGSILMNILAYFAIVGIAIFLTQYLQLVKGMEPLEAALWSLIPPVATGGIAPAVTAMAHKVNRAYIMSGGFLLAAVGFGLLSQVGTATPLWVILLAASVYAGGLLGALALTTGLLLENAPPTRAGAASALLESGTQLGGALGIALLGSVGTAVYHNRTPGLLPEGLPSAASHAASETLASANAVASALPGELGERVLAGARDAFTQGLTFVALTTVGVMVASAVLAVLVLRKTGPLPAGNAPAPAVETPAGEVDNKAAFERSEVAPAG